MRRDFRIVLLLLLPALAPEVSAQGVAEVHVSPEGPVRTVAAAVGMVAPGGRVVVEAGVYREPTIVVDKRVEIVGSGNAVLDGENARQIMTITADSVVVRGLHFQNVGVTFVEDRSAVRVEAAHYCTIDGNTFQNAFFGIYLAKSSHCTITDNTLVAAGTRQTNSGNGIHLWYCRYVTIRGNTVRGHRDGIYLEFVEDSRVLDNLSEDNLRYGLHFMFSDRNTYAGNRFRRNNSGVAVMYAKHIQMRDNQFVDNWGSAAYGLLLKDITDSVIEGNLFLRDTVGLYAEGSNRLQVRKNRFVQNGWAVKILSNAEDNRFTHNDFAGNTFDVATNSRHTYSTFDANYWDAYEGYDLDRDGFGDVAFRPVRLFSLLVERNEPSLILLRSFFIDVLDAAERVLPVLTPETLADQHPLMHPYDATPDRTADVASRLNQRNDP